MTHEKDFFLNFRRIGIAASIAVIAILFAGCADGDGVINSKDIDDDNDGLIEIYTLAQLNSMRYNVAGTGYQESSTAATVTTGAPTAATKNCTNAVGGVYLCGYELMNDLDFDTDGDNASFTVNTISTTQITATGDEQDYYYNGGSGWDPICTGSCTAFTGIFEGNGHTISNLYINYNGSVRNGTGLFGKASGRIQNVRLTDIYVQNRVSGDSNVGGLVGDGTGSTIVNSHGTGIVQGEKDNTSGKVGGLAGSGNTIMSSQFRGSVIGGKKVGGLAGVTASTVMGSHVTGDTNDLISGSTVGGLVGEMTRGTIQASYAAIDVDGSDTVAGNIGGLVGAQMGGRIAASYAAGMVSGKDVIGLRIGGLVGYQHGNCSIVASYAAGAVNGGNSTNSSDKSERVGGLLGEQRGTIVGSYAVGNVAGNDGSFSRIGGLVGWEHSSSTITASYATGNVEGGRNAEDHVGGLVGVNSGGTITASYATGNVDGGAGNSDSVGSLVGWQYDHRSATAIVTATASYGFGTVAGQDNTEGVSPSLPAGVTTPTDLIAANAGSCNPTTTALTQTTCETASGTWTSWNAQAGGINAWDFGDGTQAQAPALRFADYDGTGGTDYCGTVIPNKFADESAITCGDNGSLLPGQGR